MKLCYMFLITAGGFLTCLQPAKAQRPGGVSGPALWLRADSSVTPATNGSSITSWVDQAQGITAAAMSGAATPVYLTGANSNFNFNPAVSFTATAQALGNPNLFVPAGSQKMDVFTVFRDGTGRAGNIFSTDNYDSCNVTGTNTKFAWNNVFWSTFSSAKYTVSTIPSGPRTSANLTNFSVNPNVTATSPAVIECNQWNPLYIDTLNPSSKSGVITYLNGGAALGNGQQIPSSPGTPGYLHASGGKGFLLGAQTQSGGAGLALVSKVAEVIVFPFTLTAVQRQQVHSYLALKYGITLSQTTATNYLASDNTVCWDATANNTNKNNIIGLGRDDSSKLYQKQSRSVSVASNPAGYNYLTIALGNAVAATNQANANTITNDKSFIVVGDNNSSIAVSGTLQMKTINGEARKVYIQSRIWKLQKTNWNDTDPADSSISLKADLTQNTTGNVPNYLILADDSTSTTNVAYYPLDATGLATVGSSQLTSGRYFSFAYVAPLPRLNAKVLLQGSFNTTTNVMTTTLNTSGLLPLTQPYSSSSAFGIATSLGYDTTVTAVSIPATAVDWVLVELRNNTTSSYTTIERRVGLVDINGNLVDVNGTAGIDFADANAGTSAYIVIRHRNHLAVMSSAAVSFPAAGGAATLYDFTTAQSQAYQNPAITSNAAMAALSNGQFAMWGGNAIPDGILRASGGGGINDYQKILSTLGGSATILSGQYSPFDINLDGTVRASGGGAINDYQKVINFLGNVSNIYQAHCY